MTKKKILIYTIIFIIAVSLSGWYKYSVKNSPSTKFNDACKLVINTTCQQYIKEITAEKKYEEALEIQKFRIIENKKILKFYKSKITNKSIIKMDATKASAELIKGINTEQGKKDYFLLKTAEFTLMDIIADSVTVAQIQHKEFGKTKDAIKTISNAINLLNKNKFVTNQEKIIEFLENQLLQLTEQTE